MKDKLKRNKWWNLPAKNPTQNILRRFMRTSHKEIVSEFEKGRKEFNDNIFMKNKWEE